MIGKKGKERNREEIIEQEAEDEEIESNENSIEAEVMEKDPEDMSGAAELEKKEQNWQQEKEKLLDQIKRKQADIDNLRRIGKQEQAEAREYALQEFLGRLLPVLDNIERGLQAACTDESIPSGYVEGLKMIHKQLVQILEQEGVTLIEAEGCKFDPNCHHAVMQEDSEESEPGTVLEELQKGYRHKKRILRPSMVKVCRE